MKSVLGRAKRSVDNTFNAYLGRAAFAACLIGAIALLLRGVWLLVANSYGPMSGYFAVAAVLALVGLVIRSIVIANEKVSKEEVAARARIEAEKNSKATDGLPFDVSDIASAIPLIMPLLRSSKSAPLIAIATAIGGYVFMSKSNSFTTQPTRPDRLHS